MFSIVTGINSILEKKEKGDAAVWQNCKQRAHMPALQRDFPPKQTNKNRPRETNCIFSKIPLAPLAKTDDAVVLQS